MAQPHPQAGQAPLNPMPAGTVPLGPESSRVTCPSCGSVVQSTVRMQPTTQTHLVALLLCCLCIFCTCIPYCVDSCQSAEHYCPNCDAFLGSYKR